LPVFAGFSAHDAGMMIRRGTVLPLRKAATLPRHAGQEIARRRRSAAAFPSRRIVGGKIMAIRHKVGTIAGTMAVSLAFFPGTANAHAMSFNQKVASYVETFIGRVPYAYGGSSPATGFDCSGLAQYVYRHNGKSIPRTADQQFRSFRRESRSAAWGGDLVFFHVSSDPNSYVYHVAVYEGGNHIVSATDPAGGIRWQAIWSSDVTFGTISH
jgi:cell wall-associated NlpC family hydrolase